MISRHNSSIVFSSGVGICVVAVLLVAVPPLGVAVALAWPAITIFRVHQRKSRRRLAELRHRQIWGY